MNSVKLILFKHHPINLVIYFSLLSMESGVSSCNRGLQNLDFLGCDGLGNGGLDLSFLSVFGGTLGSTSYLGNLFRRLLGCWVILKLDVERLLSGVGSGSWDNISLGNITSSLVRSTSLRVLIVVGNGGNLFLLASGGGRAVHRTISARAVLSLAVNENGSVVSSARWEVGERSGNLKRVPLSHGLSEMERFTLHLDVLTEILITVHTSSKELAVRNSAGNTFDTRSLASGEHNKTSGGRHSFVPGSFIKVSRAIGNSGSRGISKK
jgi:hypothetical protein